MLEEYDARRPEIFERTAIELARVEPSWIVEHIGSTAIPGMAAKPVIDIAVRVDSHLEVQAQFDILATHGWLRMLGAEDSLGPGQAARPAAHPYRAFLHH
jgi:GrpB-like predicted nucleotidyltransferase (UPF0157 family)